MADYGRPLDECPYGAATPVFDLPTLNANTLSDRQLQKELFDLFFDQMPSHFSALSSAIERGDPSTWRVVGHQIKGTARTLGLLTLAKTATDIEKSSILAPELFTELDQMVAAAKAAAAAYLTGVDGDTYERWLDGAHEEVVVNP